MSTQNSATPPQISIIIPVYNCVSYLSEAVQSILDQKLPHFEVLIIDDGSSDGTAEILDKLESNPSIRIFRNRHQGVSITRNLGLKMAQGEYITFLDADDAYLENVIQPALDFMTHSDDIDVLYMGHPLYCDEQLHLRPKAHQVILKTRKSQDWACQYPVAALFESTIYPSVPSLMLRRSSLGPENVFNPNMQVGEDFEFVYALLNKHKVHIWADRFVLKYRCNPNSTMNDPNTLTKRFEASEYIISTILSHEFRNIALNQMRKFYASKKQLDFIHNSISPQQVGYCVKLLADFGCDPRFDYHHLWKYGAKISIKLIIAWLKSGSESPT